MGKSDITRDIRRWYRSRGRLLPWRGSKNPYHVLLSEIMLQQTQVSRVLTKFPAFLRRFPTLRALAASRVRDVVIAWRGMGYNNRAVRLHALARTLKVRHSFVLPRTEVELRNLPGIGKYTAHAILSSVHGLAVPVVDINVRRFLSRLLYQMPTLDAMMDERRIWSDAQELLPSSRVYEWNQALMDIGALVCTARRPVCDFCPVGHRCQSRGTMRRIRSGSIRREKSHHGIPNRIYRGRIVDHLRTVRRRSGVSDRVLGRTILSAYGDSDREWLRGLLHSLERDGIVALRRTRGGIRAALA
jgi:A/G-specific adenine glycosylase